MKTMLFVFLTAVFLVSSLSGFSQSKVSKTDIQIGASIPEFVNIGVGLRTGDFSKFNIRLGNFPETDDSFLDNYTITGGFNFYFGKVNEKWNTKKWSYNPGITFFKDESKRYHWKYWFLNNSLSYDVFISKQIVFQPEFGIVIRLSETEMLKPGMSPGWSIGPDPAVLPILGIRFRYLLY